MQLVRTLSGKPNFSRSVVTFQIYCKPGAKQWPTVKLPSRTDQQIFGEICRACRRTVQQPHFGSVSIIFQVWSVKDWSQPPFSLILGCSLLWNARTQITHLEFQSLKSHHAGWDPQPAVQGTVLQIVNAKTVEKPISLSPTPHVRTRVAHPRQLFSPLLIESLLWFHPASPCTEFNRYFSWRWIEYLFQAPRFAVACPRSKIQKTNHNLVSGRVRMFLGT